MDLSLSQQVLSCPGSPLHSNVAIQDFFTTPNLHHTRDFGSSPVHQQHPTDLFWLPLLYSAHSDICSEPEVGHDVLQACLSPSETKGQQESGSKPSETSNLVLIRKQKQEGELLWLIPEQRPNPIGDQSELKPQQAVGVQKKKSHCKCRKSQCLKMYCECFRSGQICLDCDCTDCGNGNQSGENRRKAMRKLSEKQEGDLADIFEYKGCRCSRSNCLKGYCECFASGLMCGKYCSCRQCQNCTQSMKKKQQRTAGRKKALVQQKSS